MRTDLLFAVYVTEMFHVETFGRCVYASGMQTAQNERVHFKIYGINLTRSLAVLFAAVD